MRSLVVCIGIVGLLAQASCGQLPGVPGGGAAAAPIKPNPPNVTLEGVALVKSPSNSALAMYFCPQVAGSLVCRVLGAPPPMEQLTFVFDVDLLVENPNQVPLPAVEALVGFTAYPDAQGAANVGAVCVSLCPEGEICGAPPADGCSDEGTLKSREDYAAAAVGFLVNVALGNTQPSDVKVRLIDPGQSVQIKIRLELNPQTMLALISNVATDALSAVKKGKTPAFEVPYQLEGTVWVNVENFGKIAAGFGPHRDRWTLQ